MSHYKVLKYVRDSFEIAKEELKAAMAVNHKAAIERAKDKMRAFSSVLIFEDDVGFGFVEDDGEVISKEGVGVYLRQALQEVPDDWDLLYLTVYPAGDVEKVSPHVYAITENWTCVSYAVNHTMYDALLEQLAKIEDPERKQVKPLDRAISRIHKRHRTYAISPSVTYRQSGESTISGVTHSNYRQKHAGK